jgi:hypothetical protein
VTDQPLAPRSPGDAETVPASALVGAVDAVGDVATARLDAGVGDAGDVGATAAPSPPAPIVAAQWTTRPADAPWAPASVVAQLPWVRDFDYRDLECVEERTPGGWHLLGVSQRGRVHAHDGTHREDAMGMASGTRGFVLTAADGAGSSALSRVASTLTCRTIVASMQPFLDGVRAPIAAAALSETLSKALSSAVLDVCDSLRAVAEGAGMGTRDFRTTLLAVVCVDATVVSVQVGDGAVVLLGPDGAVRRLGGGDAGGYSGEVVAFVPELDAATIWTRVTTASLQDAACILVLTDGIEDPFYPVERRGAEIARQLYGGVTATADGFRAQAVHGPVVDHAQALTRLAQWIGFERRGENDDRTLVGAFRLPPAFNG